MKTSAEIVEKISKRGGGDPVVVEVPDPDGTVVMYRVTVRKGGNKSHPAILKDHTYVSTGPNSKSYTYPSLMPACSCPGSNNGTLMQYQNIVANGFEAASCRGR